MRFCPPARILRPRSSAATAREASATAAFSAARYPEAVDLAFGPYCKFGVIIKEYRNAKPIYTPSEMVGTKHMGRSVRHVRRLLQLLLANLEAEQ
jgi:hypothetical protein